MSYHYSNTPSVNLPPVSIGIPFYNAEAHLLDAIKSVFAQTHQNWELILVDDGSTDRSLEIARAIDDPRVRVYSDGQNKRLATRLNEITRRARFDFLARMDADDMMSRNRIEKQLRVLLADDDADLVTTGVCSMNNDFNPVGCRCVHNGHQVTPYTLLNNGSAIIHAAVLGRREWFLRNPYNVDIYIAQDRELWVRTFAKNDLKIVFIPDPEYYYREDGNLTHNKLMAGYRMSRKIILKTASSNFGYIDRIKAYLVNVIKCFIVGVLVHSGKLGLLRERRNTAPLDKKESDRILNEVRSIRSCKLPAHAS